MNAIYNATRFVAELYATATTDEELNTAKVLTKAIEELTRCRNCKYIRELKHNFETGKGFEDSYVCVVWEYYQEGANKEDTNLQEVGLDSRCELFCLDEKRFGLKRENDK